MHVSIYVYLWCLYTTTYGLMCGHRWPCVQMRHLDTTVWKWAYVAMYMLHPSWPFKGQGPNDSFGMWIPWQTFLSGTLGAYQACSMTTHLALHSYWLGPPPFSPLKMLHCLVLISSLQQSFSPSFYSLFLEGWLINRNRIGSLLSVHFFSYFCSSEFIVPQ